MRPTRRCVAAAAAAAATLLAACSDDSSGGGEQQRSIELVSSLEQFDSCEELDTWVQEELAPRVGAYGFEDAGSPREEILDEPVEAEPRGDGDASAVDEDLAFEDEDFSADREAPGEALESETGSAPDIGDETRAEAEAEAPAEAPGDASSAEAAEAPAADGAEGGDNSTQTAESADDGDTPDYSETNVQVEGVAEPDMVKTDGTRILALADGQLHLASADGGQVLDTLDLPDELYSAQMMLSGDRVVLFGEATYEIFSGTGPAAVVPEVGRSTVDDVDIATDDMAVEPAGTTVAQVDIVDEELELTETLALEGTYVSTRMIDGVVRLVLHSDGYDQFPFVYPGGTSEEAEAQAAEVNQTLVESAEPEDLLPGWARLDSDGEVLEEGALLDCEQAHAPQDFAGFGMLSVVTIDVSEGLADGVGSSDGAGVMADGDTVYASHENLYVASPEWVEWDTLSEDEVREAETSYGTSIHKFDISDPAQAVYSMSGRVDGWLLNQFALDEHDGRLRVATTTGSPWGGVDETSESHVFVLEPGDDALVEVGSVSGLGEGESIFAVRFMGDVGYVVTFEQTDPLYTIDLSDPTDPQEKGELKILGYSAYLHPVADGWLLGVGQDADELGSTEGTQVSLFDVRDLENPQRVAQETLPNAESAAEWDHRAFLWWAETELAAIPVSTYDWDSEDSLEGLVGFTVDTEAQEITELGRISHPEQEDDYDYGHPEPGCEIVEDDEASCADIAEPGPWTWTPAIMRSLVIDDQLWTLSSEGLAYSDLETLGDTTFIEFPD